MQKNKLQKNQIHHGSSELGVGIGTHHLLSGSKSSWSSAIRPCKPMHGPVVVVVVLSAPTTLNRRFLNNGVILEKYNEAINLVFQSAFTIPFWRMNTPRSHFLRTIRTVLCRSPEKRLGLQQRDEGLGDWVRGLASCLTMVAVKTTQIQMTENGEIFEKRMTPFFSSLRKSRTKSREKPGTHKESHDKKKCELVVGRVTHEDQVARAP